MQYGKALQYVAIYNKMEKMDAKDARNREEVLLQSSSLTTPSNQAPCACNDSYREQ